MHVLYILLGFDDHIGAGEMLPDSMDMPHPSPQEKTTPSSSSSPFIESKASAYSSHVASVMGERSAMEFLELLPAGATRKTAGIALSHILSKPL